MKRKRFKIFKLSMIEGTKPWEPWYDKVSNQVIIAKTEKEARKLAAMNCGLEEEIAWLHEGYSTCEEIKLDKEQIILASEMWA